MTMAIDPRADRRRLCWLIAALLAASMLLTAAWQPADASWDTRNYHLYNPFALFNKPFGTDIAPAHLQTFFSPTLDLYFYGLVRTVHWTPLFNALFALPQAIAVVLAYVLTRRLLRPSSSAGELAAALFTVVGATGVAGMSTLATAMSEMLPASLFLAALLLLIRADFTLPGRGRVFAAGLLLGSACGLKLTMTYVVFSLLLALLIIPRERRTDWLVRPICFGVGVGLGAVALSGYWWAIEWVRFQNPVFPMMNTLFQSPWAARQSFVDPTFLPHSLGEALSAPWSWALRLSWAVNESRLRDPRFALSIAAAIVCLGAAALRPSRTRWPYVFLPALFVLGFALWRVEFSIFRYLASFELLSGLIMALGMRALLAHREASRLEPLAAAGALAVCLVLTVMPHVARAIAGTPPMAVSLGDVPPDSMVLILDNEPLGYVSAFLDPRVRVVATNDFFMTLDDTNPMQTRVARAIRDHAGPIWGLDCPGEQGARGDATLRRYQLERTECRTIDSNVSPQPIRMCRLARQGG